jgi:homoserine dehydrogenase
MLKENIKIGLFGFGCVGKGLWDVLEQTPGIRAEILKICVKDRSKTRPAEASYFTFDADELLYNEEIQVIVELIDDSEAAYHIVKTALCNGKAVITANKKMLAEHFEELYYLQQEYRVPLLYEAACCASIPVIRNLEEYYDNDLLHSVAGIVNGSTNFILTRIFQDGISYPEALEQAQALGFAETDPRLDVEGFDAKYKLSLLLTHAFGIRVAPEAIFNLGINRISPYDAQYAGEKDCRIKLLARAVKMPGNRVAAFVAPAFVNRDDPFYHVDNEYNAVKIQSSFADKQLFVGKGAGAFPTASAVLSDISALTYQYKYEYKKIVQSPVPELSNDFVVDVFVSYSSGRDITADFIRIEEQFSSATRNYLVGSICFETLLASEWVQDPAYSIILKAETETPVIRYEPEAEPAFQY